MRYLIITIILFSLSLNSCISPSPIDLDDVFEEKIIIEATIFEDEYARVLISKSVSKTDENIFPRVENAQIILSNNGNEETLKNRSNGLYESEEIVGIVGEIYELEVKIDNQIYRAISTLPEQSIFLDSIVFKQEINFQDSNYISPLNIFLYTSDNITSKDYGFFDLTIGNAQSQSTFHLFEDDNSDPCTNFWTENTVFQGTELRVDLFQVDEDVFKYFEGLKQINSRVDFIGLPVAPPANLEGNFTNGALGYFGAMNTDSIVRVLGQ